ncbi:MAG: FAD-dependent oxidoreductase [Desulfobacterales bacterium]|nr:FAD-dependent oxidoreductase [Desulfobacterales bacterium]
MGKQLLLVGGGHAHMMTLAALHTFIEKGHGVTVIGPSAYHYYSGMGPGMLGKTYTPEDIRFATQRLVEAQGGKFILGKAARVDPGNHIVALESGQEVPYDVVSFNAGSQVPPLGAQRDTNNIYSVKPIERLQVAQAQLEALLSVRPIRVGIIGGGPSSAEVAGNVWRLAVDLGKNTADIKIFSGHTFMGRFPNGIRKRAIRSLSSRGIKIFEHARVQEIKGGGVILETGEKHELDFHFLALGVKPCAIFGASGLPTGPEGGLRVNQFLQSPAYPDIFGGGDCIYFQDQPLDKVGVYAVRENPVLLNNLMAQLDGTALMPFDPGGDYLLIFNMGDGTGILHKKGVTIGGKPAFMIKDYIDRRFMRKFQSLEKRNI